MAEFAALGAAAALAAMVFASRLPPGADFLLPRRAGFGLFQAAWALFSSALGRSLYSAAVTALLLGSAAGLAFSFRRAAPKRLPASWSGRAGLLLGPLFAAFLAMRLGARVLDFVQLAAFPYGSLDAREPLATFLLFAAALLSAAAAARAWLSGRRKKASLWFTVLIAADLAAVFANASLGVGRELAPPPARGRTRYAVLIEGPRGPDVETYVLAPDAFADPDPAPYYRGLLASSIPDARAVPALRALYESETKRWDPAGLREALLLGCSRGDPLAPSLLLAHLTAVPPSPEAAAALGALADVDSWRIGPQGAAAIARAYAHQGDRAAAARWAEKAGGPRGVPAGLLGLENGGALKPGRISGVVRSSERTRVALYLKTDPAAPYLLDAAGLVAAADPDSKGRFVFSGLTAGRYYLAFAVSDGDGPRGEISVSGSRGDLVLDARRPALDLPPLSLKLTPR